MRKILSVAMAAVIAASAMSVCGVSAMAQTSFVPGDVDMDGVVTGHDAAMVSRYLSVDPELLDDTQLALADVNEDGVVDVTDADLIYANEVCALGVVTDTAEFVTPDAAYVALCVVASENLGTLSITDDATMSYSINEGTTISQVVYNLVDVDGDGEVTLDDACCSLGAYATIMLEGTEVLDVFYESGRYDLGYDVIDSAPCEVGYNVGDETMEALGF